VPAHPRLANYDRASWFALLPFVATILASRSMALRVAFNATPLFSPLTGVGTYIVRLGEGLAATGEVDQFSFYGHRWRHEPPFLSEPGIRRSVVRSLRDAIKPLVPFGRDLRAAQQGIMFTRGLRRNAIELYHEPNYVPLSYDVPFVTTVHDLSWLRYPETHPRGRVRWLERGLPPALDRAAAILVDSEFVRSEVIATFRVDARRVHTAYLGVSSKFRPHSAMETASALRGFDLTHGEYLLTVGTIEPRKNVGHVLRAYARLPAKLRDRYPLVVAGARGWRASRLERELRSLAGRGGIRLLGHVPAADLPSLYAGSAAFVFASLYEGFGLPPLEAMACGVPVLVSNRGALPEITGNVGVKIDPEQPEHTARKIEALLEDPVASAERARLGIRRAAAFSWDACARATLNVYRTIR
jgi:glycosyltransferase involved in cell wall biosynthesis